MGDMTEYIMGDEFSKTATNYSKGIDLSDTTSHRTVTDKYEHTPERESAIVNLCEDWSAAETANDLGIASWLSTQNDGKSFDKNMTLWRRGRYFKNVANDDLLEKKVNSFCDACVTHGKQFVHSAHHDTEQAQLIEGGLLHYFALVTI